MTALPCSGDTAIVAPSPSASCRRRRRTHATLAAALAAALLLGACGVGRAGGTDSSGSSPIDDSLDAREELFLDVSFERIDQRIDDRVAAAGLRGAALVVEPTDGEGHLHSVGAVGLETEVPMAESSMWLTAAVLLTLVDDGTLALDAPVGERLPWMTGAAGAITLRQLLSHTSGLPTTVECAQPTPESCDLAIGSTALIETPGEGFHVTDLDAHLAGRLAETTTGRSWADLYDERIAGPVGMTVTSYADPTTTGGLVAIDGVTTPTDFGRFLAVIRDDGRAGGVQVISEASVREMLLDQTVRLDTHTEPWVAETGVPTYGLGVWRDRLRGDDVASVVSAPNRYGLYPFVDDGRSAWGIVVFDDRTSPRADAVSASATITQLTAAALRRSPD